MDYRIKIDDDRREDEEDLAIEKMIYQDGHDCDQDCKNCENLGC